MRFIKLLLLFLLPLLLNAQVGEQLIRVHNVANTTNMNNISSPNEGNLVYVQSNDQINYYDGSAWQALGSGSSSDWELSGNAINSNHFLGSTNNQNLNLVSNGALRLLITNNGRIAIGTYTPSEIFEVVAVGGSDGLVISNNGNVGIDTDSPNEKLHVVGNILATGSITPDYVFEHYFEGESERNPNYEFMDIHETMDFAKKHKHLPNVSSAKTIEKQKGVIINKATEENLEKIEELYLHLYELQQKVIALRKRIEERN